MLKAAAIGLLVFEYHEIGTWEMHSLRSVVDRLEGVGYVCYMDGSPTMARLTGSCW